MEANKMKCQELDVMIISAALIFGRSHCEPAQWKAATFLAKINYDSYCLNASFDCTVCWCSLSFSYTIIWVCGEGPTLTRLSATNCQLSSKAQVGNLVKLGWATIRTIPRFVDKRRRIFTIMPRPKWLTTFLFDGFTYFKSFTRNGHIKKEAVKLL